MNEYTKKRNIQICLMLQKGCKYKEIEKVLRVSSRDIAWVVKDYKANPNNYPELEITDELSIDGKIIESESESESEPIISYEENSKGKVIGNIMYYGDDVIRIPKDDFIDIMIILETKHFKNAQLEMFWQFFLNKLRGYL